MLGKMIIPLALGGGLLFLLASSSSASAAPPAGNPLNSLPDDLKQLSGQALATNDPGTLEQVAAQLESRGFPDSGRLLRVQAASIRQQRGAAAPVSPGVTNPLNSLPDDLRSLSGQALGTNDPGTLEQVASQLESRGFAESGRLLRVQAATIRQQRPASAPVASASVAPAAPPAPVPQSPPVMSAELQQMIAESVKNGTAPALTSTAFVVERAGFPAAAEDLRKRAKEVAATVAPPAAQDRPNVALDPAMPPDLALEVARQLQLQGDPAMLEGLAAEMRKRGFGKTADQLQAKATQIRAALDAARTMNDIDREFKSPGIVPPSQQFTPGPGVAPPAPSGSAPTAAFPVTVTATPSAPLPVPATPQPQPVPPEKSKAQILATSLATSLNDLLDRYGSVPKARYKEDKASVQRFQTQEGLQADGAYGPTTAQHVARYVSDVPPPFYWKKGAGQKDLSIYRSNLESIALDAEQQGNRDRAERLRTSALKASLA